MSADLALTGVKVLTMDPSQPCAEAIAVKGNRIMKVGTNEQINQLVGKNTKVVRLSGKTVVPGFIDTHIHVGDFGRILTWMDLGEVESIREMQKSLSRQVKKAARGKWIIGRGWNENRFADKKLPTRFDLDVVSPDNPVIFYHQSGQMCVVNSKALDLAGVNEQTSSLPDGAIEKDAGTGELTGVLLGNSTNLVWRVIPEPNEEELMEAADLACEKIVEAGVTSAHWLVLSPMEIQVIKRLSREKKLPLRVYVVVPLNLLSEVIALASSVNFEGVAVKVGGVEIFADGYLAARTAALLQPYSDDPAASGKLLCTQDELNASAAKILKAGLQLVIHAMGDKALDAALIIIEQTSIEAPAKDLRVRVEQAAVLNEELLQRMKKHKVIVSVQPCVVASEFSMWAAVDHLGPERARWLFPIKTLLKEGVRVVGGSDCPMEPLNPMIGIQSAVAREFFPEERVTVNEALRMYTIDAAYSSGEERIKGSIEEGKLADLAVVSRNPLMVPLNEIKDIEVNMTIIDGKIVYFKQ
jgi:predicted amidohydrolase YtcJ